MLKIQKILPLILLFTLAALTSNSLFAMPEGGEVEAGVATFSSPDHSTLNITSADKTVINFNSFNIATGETVNFIQPTSSSTLLSRVTGNSSSEILGSLSANGILILTNPNGINFGPQANVSVNSLIALSLDITTNNFINGNYVFEHNPNSAFSQILNEGVNEGVIEGNNIALVASSIKNTGIIQATLGIVHLAAGDKATVSFDARGLIAVELNQAVSSKVYTADGKSIEDAVANSGTITAAQVYMSAKTAADIFENALNQTGIIRATSLIEENGIIKLVANRNIQAQGTLEAKNGNIIITSQDFISVNSEFRTTGNTNLSANRDILINANLTTTDGNLELLADNDLDGIGSFKQAKGTFITTVNFGDITIQSSGEATLANINSAASLILKQAGAKASFTQQPNSTIITRGSIQINPGVTLNAANSLFQIGKDWVNLGIFNPQTSTVSLISKETASVVGSNIFYNFAISTPGKIVRFDSEKTLGILGNLTLKGEYGNLLVLSSIEPPKQWKINPLGTTDIAYTLISDSVNIRGPPLKALHSDSSGNNTNWNISIRWTGQGSNSNWSTSHNWDTGTLPSITSVVTFDGKTGLNPNKDSTVDPLFQGKIGFFRNYCGVITVRC